MIHPGSVENLDKHKNHNIVCEGHQSQVAALAPVFMSTQIRTLPPFDHRHHRFYLHPVAVNFAIKLGLHQSSVTPRGRFVGRPAVLRRDECADAVLVARN